MSIDLRMEPYATMFEEDRPGLQILDEFCFPDIDKLFGHLGMRRDDYSIDAVNGRLPHDAALRLLAAVESHQLPPELNRGNARSALDRQARQAARPASLLPQLVRASRPCSHADAAIRRKRTRHGRQDWPRYPNPSGSPGWCWREKREAPGLILAWLLRSR
jgi:hypothetical protein